MIRPPRVTVIEHCLCCGSAALQPVHSFGETPIADHLLTTDELEQPDIRVPLDLQFCPDCTLLLLAQSVDPGWLFGERYPYFSSVTASLRDHSLRNVERLLERRPLDESSLVVEIASNDGYLLQYFTAREVPALGIEPSPRQAAAAQARGIATLNEFFDLGLAERLAAEGRQADVVIANNVLAHVPQLNDFVAGVARLLKEDGIASIEVPYVVDLVERLEFDTIYHQHLCYFSVTALDRLFRRHGLHLNAVERLEVLGGSLRLTIGKQERADGSVDALLQAERAAGVDSAGYFREFATRLAAWRAQLLELIGTLTANGKRVAAYGASAKATMLLAYAGLDSTTVEFVVDRNPAKQGHYLPVSRVPVRPVETLLRERPDYTLLLVWNIAEEVLAQQVEYRQRGGRFIIPVPEPVVV